MDGLLGIGGRPGLSGRRPSGSRRSPRTPGSWPWTCPAAPTRRARRRSATPCSPTRRSPSAWPSRSTCCPRPSRADGYVVDIGLTGRRHPARASGVRKMKRAPAGRGAADVRRRPAALAGTGCELGQVLPGRRGHRRGHADLPGGGRAQRARRARRRAGNGPVRRAARGPGPGPRGRAGGGHRRGTGAGVGMRVGVRPGRPRQGRLGAEAPRRGGAGQRPAGGRRRRRAGAAGPSRGAHPAHAARGGAGPAADPAPRRGGQPRAGVQRAARPRPRGRRTDRVHGAAQGVAHARRQP